MGSEVYFNKYLSTAVKLFDIAGFAKLVTPDDPVALKIHFGEPGIYFFTSKNLTAKIQ